LETLFEDGEREEGGSGCSSDVTNSSNPFVDFSILFIIIFY
jgi:hypothetical protein